MKGIAILVCGDGASARRLRRLGQELRPPTSELQQQADIYAIDQIEKTWHKASSTQNVDLMMTHLGARRDVQHRHARRSREGARSGTSSPQGGPVPARRTTGSRTRPPTRSGSRSNGDKGTLYFECHYVDVEDRQGRLGRGRRPERAEDRRQVADHELCGGDADARV